VWGFQTKRNALHEQLILQAPEVNPSEFVRRYLLQKPTSKFNHHARHVQLTHVELMQSAVKSQR
jgi:hypothetical protein